MSEFTNDSLKELFIDLHMQDMLDLHDYICSRWQEYGYFHESKSHEFIHAIMDCVKFESVDLENEEEIDLEIGF